MYGDDVATLQARLQDLGFYTDLVDGHFGLQTHNALMSYQREYGLYPDGICGPETLRSLYFLGSRVTGGSPHAIREEELVRSSGPRLSGKRIIIDPGRGGDDHGLIMNGPAGPISEADILWDLASRLEGRMTAIGMETFLSRPANRGPVGRRARGHRQYRRRRPDDQPALRDATPVPPPTVSPRSTSATRTVRCPPSAATSPTSSSEKLWRAPDYVTAGSTAGPGICFG